MNVTNSLQMLLQTRERGNFQLIFQFLVKTLNVNHATVEFINCCRHTAFVRFKAILRPAPPIRPYVHKTRLLIHVQVQVTVIVSETNECVGCAHRQARTQLEQAVDDVLSPIIEDFGPPFVNGLAHKRRYEGHFVALLSCLGSFALHFLVGEKASKHQLLAAFVEGEINLPVYAHLIGNF